MKKFLLIAVTLFCLIFAAACTSSETSASVKNDNSESVENSTITQSSTTTPTSSVASVSTKKATDAVFQPARRTEFVQGEALSAISYVAVTYDDGSKMTYYMGEPYTVETNYDANVPGTYNVSLKIGNLTPFTYTVTVIAKPEVKSGKIMIKVDKDYSGLKGEINAQDYAQYKSINDAIDMLKFAKYDSAVIKEFYLAEQTFKEKINIRNDLTNIHFIGTNAANTIVTYDDCSSKVGGTDYSASITVNASGFVATKVTFANDYDFLNGTEANKQATAALINADKCSFTDCVFLGYQDTLQAKSGRQYYKNCTIKGTVDFIFGNNAAALFDSCEIVSRFTVANSTNNGYIAAPKGTDGKTPSTPTYGYVFLNCNITAESGVGEGTVSLARPWRGDSTVAYINCAMGAHISKLAYVAPTESTTTVKSRYFNMVSSGVDALPKDAHYSEYGNTGLGAISAAEYEASPIQDFTMLSETQAANYTITNIFATTNGQLTFTGEWNPIA